MKQPFSFIILLGLFTLLGQGCYSLTVTEESAGAGLVKGSGSAVYYLAGDHLRYVFPNEKTYFTWYQDFGSVETISDDELAAITIGGNVTYKPAVKLVKVQTDPRVYAVGAGGVLRWIKSEQIARELYGSNWAKQVDDIPDAFFVDYRIGLPILTASDFPRNHSYYARVTLDGYAGSGDLSEIPPDIPLYPNGQLTGISSLDAETFALSEMQLSESETTPGFSISYLMTTTDATSTVLSYMDTALQANGYQKEMNNVMLNILAEQGFRGYEKSISETDQASVLLLASEDSLFVSYAEGPKDPPFPGIVPIYPGADEFIRAVDEAEQTASYMGFTYDAFSNVFNWYQAQLAKLSWLEIRNEDKDADIIRIYERQVGNQLFNLKLFIGAVDPADDLGAYQTGFFILYGPSDLPEFAPGAEINPIF